MKDILKNPKKQITIILVLILGYWTYDIMFSKKHIPVTTHTEQTEEVQEDTVIVERIPEVLQRQSEMNAPPTDNSKRESTNNSVDIEKEYQLKIQFWDMVFNHLKSIVGTIAALLSPLVTVYLNKKGYFESSIEPKPEES